MNQCDRCAYCVSRISIDRSELISIIDWKVDRCSARVARALLLYSTLAVARKLLSTRHADQLCNVCGTEYRRGRPNCSNVQVRHRNNRPSNGHKARRTAGLHMSVERRRSTDRLTLSIPSIQRFITRRPGVCVCLATLVDYGTAELIQVWHASPLSDLVAEPSSLCRPRLWEVYIPPYRNWRNYRNPIITCSSKRLR